MKEVINVSQKLTMSSREIAELTGKRHAHVMRDIQSLKKQLGYMFGGGISKTGYTHKTNKNTKSIC